MLGLPPGPGLVDVLTGDASLEDALIEIPDYRLTVLRAGRTYERSAEMLGSAPMRRLMDTLRSEFDRIVIDSAPTTVTDPVAVLTLADSVILVVREGTTTKPAIAHAVSSLGTTKLLGMVFNASTGAAAAALCDDRLRRASIGGSCCEDPRLRHAVVQTVCVGARFDRIRIRDSVDCRVAARRDAALRSKQ